MIRVYLRASTAEQNAERAKETIDTFLTSHNQVADCYYVENESGTKLKRPELMKLLSDSKAGDILVIEQVDRLTRLTSEDWKTLKREIEDKGIHIVSLDLPTSWIVLTQGNSNGLVNDILIHVNNLLLEILATTARKDQVDRKRRQAEGIAIAQAAGKYRGKPQSSATIRKCEEAKALIERGYKKEDAAKLSKIGVATLYRYLKENK